MSFPMVQKFERKLSAIAPFMGSTVEKARKAFGQEWERQFEVTLQKMFQDERKLESAIKGYVRFALEAVKLQKRFEREKVYVAKTYEEAAQAVYHNEEYMLNLYLPGILLSHYLWPHHFRQLLYFQEKFVPAVLQSSDKSFCDVGIGSGFYSRQMLQTAADSRGNAYDISAYAQTYSNFQINAFDMIDRWQFELRNVITDTPKRSWPFLLSVEVLEHLEDPLSFLHALRKMLAPGGRGFITAALTAPNEDHIYLYNNCEEIIEQLRQANFKLIDYKEEYAYESRAGEPVPRIAAFIVS